MACPFITASDRDDRYDLDGDGLDWSEDCDDDDPNVGGPSTYFYDADSDGFGTSSVSTESCSPPEQYADNDDDCDDIDPATNPETWWYPDSDSDGFGSLLGLQACERPADGYLNATGDCNDGDPTINPGVAEEICNDGQDNDCNGSPGDCSLFGDLNLEDAYVVYSSTRAGSDLGTSVLLHPDFDDDGEVDLIAGAPGMANTNIDVGGIVTKSPWVGGNISVTASDVVVTPATAGSDNSKGFGFAHTLAFAGDLNGDGYTDLVVGAPWDVSGGSEAGTVFTLLGPNYNSPLDGPALQGDEGMLVGWSLAAGYDVSDDGIADVLIGAPGVNSQHSKGNAYLHLDADKTFVAVYNATQSSAPPINSVSVVSFDGQNEVRNFGYAAVMGDVTGDGFADLIISAPNASADASADFEAVFTFHCPCNTSRSSDEADAKLTHDTTISPESSSSAVRGYGFGWSLALHYGTDRSGLPDLLVGAPYTDGGAVSSGAAMLFNADLGFDGDATRTDKSTSRYSGELVLFEGTKSLEGFGHRVASVSDLDNDGSSDIAISHIDGTTSIFTDFEFGQTYDSDKATATILVDAEGVEDGVRLFGGVDVNDDGIPDLAIGLAQSGEAEFGGIIAVFLGGGY
jgi:hypothetical protein